MNIMKNFDTFVNESKKEEKKYKLGDKWSTDFDYAGMLKYCLTVCDKCDVDILNKLHKSLEDVNYHTIGRALTAVIKVLEEEKDASKEIKEFKNKVKEEIRSQK